MRYWRRTFYTICVTEFLRWPVFRLCLPLCRTLWKNWESRMSSRSLCGPGWPNRRWRWGWPSCAGVGPPGGSLRPQSHGHARHVGGRVDHGVDGVCDQRRATGGAAFAARGFTGTVAAATTLVASVVPRERSGASMGSLQTAIYLGTAFGPILGGISGDHLGYRPSFWITGALLFLSGILVTALVHEDFQPARVEKRSPREGLKQAGEFVFASGGTLAVLLAARLLTRGGQPGAERRVALVHPGPDAWARADCDDHRNRGRRDGGQRCDRIACHRPVGRPLRSPQAADCQQFSRGAVVRAAGVRTQSFLVDRLASGSRVCHRRNDFDLDGVAPATRARPAAKARVWP